MTPVAAVRFGLGGGMGSDPDKRQEGEGGSRRIDDRVIGYIELKDGHSRFVPTIRRERMIAVVLTVAVAVLALSRTTATPQRRARRFRKD